MTRGFAVALSRQKLWKPAAVALALAVAVSTPRPARAFPVAVSPLIGCGDGTLTLIFPIFLTLSVVVVLKKGKPPVTDVAFSQTMEDTIRRLCKEVNASSSLSLQTTSAATLPVDAVAGDFDRDGNPDVAIANQGSSNVSVSLGNPDRSFQVPFEVATGTSPVRVVSGKFDADDRVDLVTANVGNGLAGNLSLLRGRANGRFRTPVSVGAGTLPVDVAAGDFDGDGDLDLVAADVAGATSSVILRLGHGNGTFGPEVALGPIGVQSLGVGQLNASDDDLDVVTTRGILLGNGNGTFAPLAPFAGGIAPSRVEVGDVNGDGVPDVVALSKAQHFVSVLLGNGDGTLQAPLDYLTGSSPERVVLFDIDDDTDVDLLVSNEGDDHLTILRGNGDGTFLGARTYPSVADLSGRSGSTSAAVADFTGDDVPDIVAANGATAVLLAGLGSTEFGDPMLLTGLGGARVVSGDWNGNGAADLAFTAPGKLAIALGNDDATFGAPTSFTLPGSDSFADFIVQARVDAGSVPDLLVANTGAGNVSVFVGNGSGGFTEKPTVAIGTFPNGIATGDFDGDAELDLVVTNLGGFGALNGSVQLVPGNGNGTFQMPELLRGGSIAPDSVVVADFDDDDHPDAAYVVEGPLFDWDVEVLFGKGNAEFEDPVRLGLPYDLVHDLRVGDFDGDGASDLVVSLEGTRAALLRNRGDRHFQAPVLFDTGGGPTLAADVDQDSLPDLVASSEIGMTAVIRNVIDEAGEEFAPDTEITNGKTLYETANPTIKLKLEFTTDEPGSAFECRLRTIKPVKDPGSWSPCASPFKKRVAPGKYRFLVRAIDVASNVDPTPAELTFRVSSN